MNLRLLLLGFLILTLPATLVFAQQSQAERLAAERREKAKKLEPNRVSPLEKRMRNWEKARMPMRIFTRGFKGFRPVLGGMRSGSGTVFGGGYIHGLENEYLQFQVNGRYSTKGYSQYDGGVEFPAPYYESWLRADVRAAYYDYTQVHFFGLGNSTSKDHRSFYRQRGYFVRGGATAKPGRFFEFRGEFGRIQTEAKEGKRSPSLETSFEGVPGFGDGTTDFNVFGGSARFKAFDKWDFPPVGFDLTVEGWRYDDQSSEQYDTVHVVGLLRAQVPLGPRNRRLAFQFRTSHMQADSGKEVPFYLMETIGGANTLRGYSEFRFRDRRNLIMNLEYRWELMPYVDFAVFTDAGKAFADFSDFDLKGLHWGGGWGIRLHAPGGFFFNLDLAGSKEGFVVHIGGGPRF